MEQSTFIGGANLDRAMKPFALPLGLASPMWLAYGAAAGVGATWWWMSKMSRFVAPGLPQPLTAFKMPMSVPTTPVATAQPAIAVLEAPVVSAPVELAIASEPVMPAPAPVETAPAEIQPPVAEAVSEVVSDQPDELTLLRGVGPRVADALVARGVTTFAQLAAWTDHEMATFDRELKLLGRSQRYDILGQARALAENAARTN